MDDYQYYSSLRDQYNKDIQIQHKLIMFHFLLLTIFSIPIWDFIIEDKNEKQFSNIIIIVSCIMTSFNSIYFLFLFQAINHKCKVLHERMIKLEKMPHNKIQPLFSLDGYGYATLVNPRKKFLNKIIPRTATYAYFGKLGWIIALISYIVSTIILLSKYNG